MQAPISDDTHANGARRVLSVLAHDYEKENPPASRHLAELAAGRVDPPLDQMRVAELADLADVLLEAAKSVGRKKVEYFNVTEPEQARAVTVLIDEIARIRIRLIEVAMPRPLH
jgi:hypothetical protein